MKKKVLLTGGAGFIGSHIAEELLKKDYHVRIIDNFSTGKKENLKSFVGDVELIEGDIRDFNTVAKVVNGMQIVIHQAALPSVPRSISDPVTTNDVNVTGTLNLLWCAVQNKTEKFLFASSSSVYGNCNELVKHEKIVTNPLSPYAVTKLTGENYCRVFSETYDLQTVCLRYFNVFGPRQDPNSQYSAVIPKFISTMKRGDKPVIYGDGEQTRDFTYVKNVVTANLLAVENAKEKNLIINCACNRQISLNDMVAQLNSKLNLTIDPVYQEERTGDIKHSYADISLAKEKINYVPEIYFEGGLELTLKNF